MIRIVKALMALTLLAGLLVSGSVADAMTQRAEILNWDGWQRLGTVYDKGNQVTVAQHLNDGRLEAFIIGTDNSIYHNWQATAGDDRWVGWQRLGPGYGQGKQVTVARNDDGQLEVFIIGTDNGIYHNWQITAGGVDGWFGWRILGPGYGQGKQITVARNADGRLEAFIIGTDNGIYHNWQVIAGNVDRWAGWQRLGTANERGNQITVAQNYDGRLEAFIIGTDNGIYHNRQATAGGWN